MKGTNCALKLQKKRKAYLKKMYTPFRFKYHTTSGVVAGFSEKEANQPSSGTRTCAIVSVKLLNSKIVAYIPYCGMRDRIKIHDKVTIQSIGGPKGRKKGDIAGVSYRVIKINDACIKQKFLNKV